MNLRPPGYEPGELPDCSTPRCFFFFLMGREGFEPSKALPADLQSVPFGHSGICPFFQGKPDFIYHCLLKADERTRTVNLLITNQLLCQLSHIGILNFCNKPLCSIVRAKLRLIALLLLTCVNKPKLSHIGLFCFINKLSCLFSFYLSVVGPTGLEPVTPCL